MNNKKMEKYLIKHLIFLIGDRSLSECSKDIGIDILDLVDILNGNIPSLESLGLVCVWSEFDPFTLLNVSAKQFPCLIEQDLSYA